MMTLFTSTIHDVDILCRKNKIKYVIIGGIASIHYGCHRTTKDIDMTVQIPLEKLDFCYELFTRHFTPIKKNALDFFKQYFVLPMSHKKTGMQVDLSAGLSGFDDQVIRRRRRGELGGVKTYFCSKEDLIIYKLVANRPIDQQDVSEIMMRHYRKLDKDYLKKTAELFTEADRSDVPESLAFLLAQFEIQDI
jgi:predicted nucleotidyltransferase